MAFGSDYPNLAILSQLTMLQKPLRELAGSHTVLFNTCLTKKLLQRESRQRMRGFETNYRAQSGTKALFHVRIAVI